MPDEHPRVGGAAPGHQLDPRHVSRADRAALWACSNTFESRQNQKVVEMLRYRGPSSRICFTRVADNRSAGSTGSKELLHDGRSPQAA